MAASNHPSEAYDLALFEPKQPKLVALPPNKKVQKLERRRTRVQSALNVAATVAVAALVIGVVSLLITSRVQLTEMNRSIDEAQQRLSELQSEQTRLEAELARELSAQSVDEYAQEQGMVAADSGQIHYITRSDGDEVETAEAPAAHWWDKLWASIVKFFS